MWEEWSVENGLMELDRCIDSDTRNIILHQQLNKCSFQTTAGETALSARYTHDGWCTIAIDSSNFYIYYKDVEYVRFYRVGENFIACRIGFKTDGGSFLIEIFKK